MKRYFTILIFAGVLLAGCKKNEVLFTYSPSEPRAGETVVFSNQTSEGEEWSWSFGDGTTSSSKSPRKVYKQPGRYEVILKADNKVSRTYSATVNVRDTVPAISVSDSVVRSFTPVTLNADAYNPFSYSQEYEWVLPKDVSITEGDTASQKLTVFFRRHDVDVPVRCIMTQGDRIWQIDTVLHVEDNPAPSLVMASRGTIHRQRIYSVGNEEPTETAVPLLTAPAALSVSGDNAYVFNADTTEAGAVVRCSLTDMTAGVALHNGVAAKKGFDRGIFRNISLYWTAYDEIYSCPADGGTAVRIAGAVDIGGLAAGQHAGGLALYNNVWLYAYGNGLHRFVRDNSGTISSLGSVLEDYAITQLAVDKVAGKVYFTAAGGLYVSSSDGSNVVLLDNEADGKALCADGENNLLLWTTADGVFCRPLVKTQNNRDAYGPEPVNNIKGITAIAVDNTAR